MRPLKDIVLALQAELDAAFANETGETAKKTGLEVEKATLSLSIGIHDQPTPAGEAAVGFFVLDEEAAAKSSGHRLTIELRVPRPVASAAAAAADDAAAAPPVPPVPPVSASILELASRVFGPPGFDNAARAEVFCEGIGGLSEAEVRAVITSLLAAAPLDAGGPLDTARARTRRLLRFSPVGEAVAAVTLAEMFRRFSAKEILAAISARWKMTTGWTPNDGAPGKFSAN